MLDPCTSSFCSPQREAAVPGRRPHTQEDTEVGQLVMAADVRLVPKAREFAVDQLLRLGGRRELVDDVRVIVDELVANAVVHSGTDSITLTVLSEWPWFVIIVADFGVWHVHPEVASRTMAETGRGLDVVAALSTSSGVCTKPSGTCVWASVSNSNCRVGTVS